MTQYNLIAEFYDYISTGLPGDKEFYLRESKGKILELGCGTGRLLIPLLKNGKKVAGLDLSKRMLEILRKKAKEQNLAPKLYLGNMINFKIKEKFDTILVPYRAFLHIENQEDQIKTLKNIRAHLKPKGRVILNFFTPDFNYILTHNGKTLKENRNFVNSVTKNKIEVYGKYNYDVANQLIRNYFILKEIKNRKIVRTYNLPLNLCFIYKREFELLLKLAGFSKWKVFGGFNYEKFTEKSKEQVWIVNK